MALLIKRIFFLAALIAVLTGCQQKAVNFLPENIGEFRKVKELTGDAAKEFVNNLHFQKVTDLENHIGFYEGEGGGLTIYITFYHDADSAEIDYRKMTRKISPRNSVFVQGEYLELEGHPCYRCYGMGQTHFVFRKDKNLVWMSVPTVGAEKLLRTYLAMVR